jgi:hypothetical protein
MQNKRITKVAQILNSPERWTQGAFARSSQPKAPNDVFDPRAEKFSLTGAINRVYLRGHVKVLPSLIKSQVRDYLKEHYGHQLTIEEWNDQPHRSFEDIQSVIQALDL